MAKLNFSKLLLQSSVSHDDFLIKNDHNYQSFDEYKYFSDIN